MKKLFNILMMLAVTVFAVSCGPDDPVDPAVITGLKTAYTIGAEGGSLELQVSANVDFTVTPADPWVKYTTTKAAETKTIVVTVEPNTSTESRTTTVTVQGKEAKAELKITQEGAAPAEPDVLEAGTTTYSVPAEGGEVNVAVTTNVDMTVTTDSGWIKYTSTKAASQKTVCFTVDANTAYEARSGKATITGGDKTVEIVFNQAAKPEEPDLDKLTVAQTEYTVGAAGGNVEVKVNTNCDEVSATVNQTWVKFFGTKARAFADKTLTFSVLANTTTEERTVTATITAGTETATVTIKQAAASGEPSEDPELSAGQATYNVAAAGETIVVDVTTNIDYTVTCDALWIKKMASKASRTDHVSFMVAPNTGEARTAKISFNYGEITVVVTVNQAAYEAPSEDVVLEVSATEFQVAAEGEELNVKVTHNYDYTVDGAPEWVVVDIDGDDCYITVAENTESEARVATLEFSSNGVKKNVVIAQEAAAGSGDPFDVGPNLSVNGTANCYVVTKAGDYYFDSTVMGNGTAGWLEEWTGLNEEYEGTKNALYPEDSNVQIVLKSITASNGAQILWQDGNCISDVKMSSDKKQISFTATGNKGNAVIALYNKYGDYIWSWHIWCTDSPVEQSIFNEGDEYVLMDRNLGALSSDPADGAKTYGLWYEWGRIHPLKAKDYINHEFLAENRYGYELGMSTMGDRSMYDAYCYPDHFWAQSSNGGNWFGPARAYVIYNNIWGNPYATEFLPSVGGEPDDPSLSELTKTIYDPCPVGYMVPPRTAFSGIRQRQCRATSYGVYVPGDEGDIFFPYTGYVDCGDQGGGSKDSGWYGYEGYNPPLRDDGLLARNEGLKATVWTSNAHEIGGGDSTWSRATAFEITNEPIDEGDPTPSGILSADANTMHLPLCGVNVRCMKIPTE